MAAKKKDAADQGPTGTEYVVKHGAVCLDVNDKRVVGDSVFESELGGQVQSLLDHGTIKVKEAAPAADPKE